MSSSTAIIFILLGSFLIVGTSLEAVVCAPEINLPSTPDGIICIGNRENPSPSHNFILFEKADEELTFLGTESRNGSFIDLRPYVTWVLSMSCVCEMKPGCKKLPPHMRGILPPSNATRVECSREKPNGEVQFFCGHNGAVDDDGALTILTILPDRTETLWY
ncbi:hypothetical protein BV898_01307 [Hypsibius exemplaris]|uniref:Uncharacterized protein n=1 Tax=Hypsibius exemplaris TaxID=2072580 RepID=A0A1W0XB16_HYPEX|nr:hypothetical protein BV898_01307 [Hypsibius exemplaris]